MEHALNIRKWREGAGLSQAKLSEITGIPQHLLSAHELGKDVLSSSMMDIVRDVANDQERLAALVSRRKRYSEHRYEAVEHDPSRLKLHIRSSGNEEYLRVLNSLARQDTCQRVPRAISLFSGCGGLSLGFKAAGVDVFAHLEIDDGLSDIYASNFTASRRIGSDIRDVNGDRLAQLKNEMGRIDLIIGGPPCQGFSLAGKRKADDPRNSLFRDYLRFVDTFRPKVAVLENVRLLTSMKDPDGRLVKDRITSEFKNRGYAVDIFEVNAQSYGVPQHRERVFFIAVDRSLKTKPSFPVPSHSETTDLFGGLVPYRTFADATSDLTYIESGESDKADPLHQAVHHPRHVLDWLWDVPQGSSAHDNADPTMRPPSGYNTTYKRQVWDEPASTVQTTFGMISGCRNVHPISTRSLTIREAARIQSFPDSYNFVGSLGTIRTGIGNAVPPLLAFAIARHFTPLISDLVEITSF